MDDRIIKPTNWWEELLFKLGFRSRFRVEGASMQPALQPQDHVLVKKCTRFEVGDVIVSKHPIQSDLVIVKQIESIDKNGRLKLVGLNSVESSHRFGLVNKKLVYGKVTSFLRYDSNVTP